MTTKDLEARADIDPELAAIIRNSERRAIAVREAHAALVEHINKEKDTWTIEDEKRAVIAAIDAYQRVMAEARPDLGQVREALESIEEQCTQYPNHPYASAKNRLVELIRIKASATLQRLDAIESQPPAKLVGAQCVCGRQMTITGNFVNASTDRVSLERCAEALEKAFEDMGFDPPEKSNVVWHKNVTAMAAQAVLDSAKQQGAKFDVTD